MHPFGCRSGALAVLLLLVGCTGEFGTGGGLPAGSSIVVDGVPVEVAVRPAGESSVRITVRPVSFPSDFPDTPALVEREYGPPAIRLRETGRAVRERIAGLDVEVRSSPLTVLVSRQDGSTIQEMVFDEDSGAMTFVVDDQPILGLGEGGPLPASDADWRALPVEFDRRGRLHEMRPRWQRDAYGSRNPVAMMVGTSGWGMFVATPWGSVDLRDGRAGTLVPREASEIDSTPQNRENQRQDLGKGLPPRESLVPGLYDVFVFDARDPNEMMRDVAELTGRAVMPPKWALGYMQSHRTLEDDAQMIRIVDTFREKRIPVDAVIYLGTGFTPRGWNTEQPSFDYNPEVFTRAGEEVIADLHRRNVKVVLHMVPFDRDCLPTLHGSIPPAPDETIDQGHVYTYWQKHVDLMNDGVDGWWPDEGDWFDLHERMARHRLYYEGPVHTRPGVRPWSLHRNGHLGIARWGGWVWSGDTDSSWRSLEAQIAVGINHSLSLSPFWGSDIGGFFPNEELTGELYARWFQFGAFTPSFRSHGRTWWTRLPWGWGLSELGPREGQATPLESELNNPAVEPIAKRYAELRYRLLPYNYTLAWQARDNGLPMMRAMWLHYPEDDRARGLGDQYLWGRDLLVAPVFQKGATSREVYLPAGTWYDWWTGEALAGGRTVVKEVDLATMPIYARAGAIIPLDPIRQYTMEPTDEPTTLRVYRGADGEFVLYEDDGESLNYLDGEYSLTRIGWVDSTSTLRIEPQEGEQPGTTPRTLRIEVLPDGITRTVIYSGASVEVPF